MTFMGKPSASHKLLADISLHGHRLETGVSLLHYVTREYCMFSSENVTEKKTLAPVSGLYLGIYVYEKASKLTLALLSFWHTPNALYHMVVKTQK